MLKIWTYNYESANTVQGTLHSFGIFIEYLRNLWYINTEILFDKRKCAEIWSKFVFLAKLKFSFTH